MGRKEGVKKMVIGSLKVEGSQTTGYGIVYDKLEVQNNRFKISIFGNHITIMPHDTTYITVFDDEKISLEHKIEQYVAKPGEPEYLNFQTIDIRAVKRMG